MKKLLIISLMLIPVICSTGYSGGADFIGQDPIRNMLDAQEFLNRYEKRPMERESMEAEQCRLQPVVRQQSSLTTLILFCKYHAIKISIAAKFVKVRIEYIDWIFYKSSSAFYPICRPYLPNNATKCFLRHSRSFYAIGPYF